MITYLRFFNPKLPQMSLICCNMSLMGRRVVGAWRPIKLHPASKPGQRARHLRAAVAESTVVETGRKKEEVNTGSVVRGLVVSAVEALKLVVVKRRNLGTHHVELLIENGITNCRFFTIMSVLGSLIGSILCFTEGCFFVTESFFKYYHKMRESSSNEVEAVHLLIEALDLFLVGTALYSFGVGMYMMFLGKGEMRQGKGIFVPSFGLFDHKQLRSIVVMRTVSEAKMKIGHSMMMILQAGVLEKFKNIPVTSALDLACFSGAILVSSLSIFLLSKISQKIKHKKNTELG